MPTTNHNIERIRAEAEDTWVYSFEDYARDLLRIQTKESTLIPFVRNPVQEIKARIKRDIRSNGRLLRLIILKARQFGISTDELMEMFHESATTPLRNNLVVTHKPDSTNYLFDVVKRAHEHIPVPKWQPELKKSNAKELIFKGIDSAIRVGTAGEDNIGSGTVVHRALLSEMAKWLKSAVDGILTSLFQAIPKTPESELVIESTAQGVGGEFHSMFWAARYQYTVFLNNGKPDFKCRINPDADPNNEYSSLFIPWFVHHEYEMDPEPGFKRTTENHPIFGNEQQLRELYGVNDSKLAWRRHTIVNECRGSLAKFNQEYPDTPEHAFLASGRPVFDPTEIIENRRKACKPPIACYILQANQWIATTPVAGDTDGILQVWQEPVGGRAYIVSADVSEGLEKGDFDSVDVIEQFTGRQVAHWHGHTSPDVLGKIMYYLGMRYNLGWVAPERNNHGLTTITQLVNMNYPNITPQIDPKPREKPKKHYGWLTGSSKTGGKTIIIDELAAFFRANPEAVNCAETCSEMLTFKHNADGTMGAEEGHFDDRVMSLAIGNFLRTRLPAPKMPQEARTSPSSSAPPASAWT